MRTSPCSLFLSWAGIQLNNYAPLTAKEAALAFFTAAWAVLGVVAITAFLPVLLFLSVKDML